MGRSFFISCKNCDYSKEFRLGIGFLYYPGNIIDFDNESALLTKLIHHSKAIDQIKNLITEKAAVLADDYGHELYYCPQCSVLYSRFFIHLDYPGGTYEVDYECNKCKTILKSISRNYGKNGILVKQHINLDKYLCPHCKQQSLYEDKKRIVLWD